jgi:aspartate aminotransferase-like enzyme
MPGLLPNVDPDGLLEYSVVYTDRALNHMSQKFQGVMRDISGVLKEVYHARSAIVVPGSGSYGMEAVARQFAGGQKTLIVRNGWFSYRWTQILDMGQIASEQQVLKARPVAPGRQAAFAPAPIAEVVAAIQAQRPAVVFAPHVETAAGLLLPDDYLRAMADAVHAVGGLLVLDCIASGALWVDMQATGVDVLVSAPQKGWSGSPCCAFVMLSDRARTAIDGTTSTSFAADLKKWLQIMETYESGGHAYHTTLPTDALTVTRNVMLAARCAPCWAATASRAWPPKASRRRAWSSATPTTWVCTPARPSWPKACRPRPACRCSVMNPPTSAPSASACSGWRSCSTWTAAWPTSKPRCCAS